MASNKKYWSSVEELNPNSSIAETLKQNEFVEEIPTDEFLGDEESLGSSSTSRRDFLKYVGFSTAAASLAACEGPVKKSIPYVVQPESIVPGVANYYATTIADGYDFASILIKTREGRPIKVESNTDAKVNGSANARVHASVLGLYDSLRVQGPKTEGEYVSWDDLDTNVVNALTKAKVTGKQIVLLTQTYASPSTKKLIAEFNEKYGNVKHIQYDAIAEDAALNAFEAVYGVRALADYDFSKAEVIVSFGADFLGDWQGGGYDSSYAKGRIPSHGKMSRHIQFESNMSLTGANADKRIPLTPSQQKVALAKFYGALNGTSVSGELPAKIEEAVKSAAAQVKKAGKKAIVVTGINDEDAQKVVLSINKTLGSAAMDANAPRLTRQGDAKQVASLVDDMNAGKVEVLVMSGVNPLYTLPNASEFEAALENVGLSVAFSLKEDETAVKANYIAAAPHYLESWGDAEMKKGHYSLMQPTIRPIFNTRQFQEALLKWSGIEKTYQEYLKETWEADILGGSSWNSALHDGVFIGSGNTAPAVEETIEAAAPVVETETSEEEEVETATVPVASLVKKLANTTSSGMELVLYPKISMGDGQQANNPWLQELPDPITRTTWDNYLTISMADAEALGVENYTVSNGGLNGGYAKVTVGDVSIEKVPVLIQPGQAKGTVGLSFGYGKKAAMKEDMKTGVNAYPLYLGFKNTQEVKIEKVSGVHEFASVQMKSTMDGRGDILRETSLEIFNTKNAHDWNPQPKVSVNHQEVPADEADLWTEFDSSIGHHFNLSIDLNACTGCGACVIACHAENNVPVVGKREVRKYRDMHWLRIDRYYSSEETFEGDNEAVEAAPNSISTYHELEHPSENPQVAFQPVMCQHCNHAPCETVCPVAATSHGKQGQNQMIYNRCVGTRYCANNCPYKVRRFNWFLYSENDEFDFHMNDDLGRMVLNPDVTVRSRGVMEKCSMCIQMTQKTILDAKREGRPIKDGEFKTACSAACSSGAMVFGDVNDKESEVVELKESNRMYHLLGFKGTRPNVFYHVKVRNTEEV
ncbi:TAT-variant-translocated molybdopterin oxidoreductase [Galbibacter sp. EGI 63066]|uniref:TAT-variant-translocated molybdopterin oxidoreductase n=1 Tax=Galbibacter sp. EGI 63066 TaxID=2993559 RepID=UPI002248A7FE|nr:TAT-variant-translocated molybdopterin oxidoreductase [Galbibacter sp. EGI 63066]MCX2681040.1 TAT-variant-translocated molybdopterin oxidoreductase [Galbibacter sp. EGI 63066]